MNSETGNPFLRFHALGYTRIVPVTPPKCEVSPRSTFAKRLAAAKGDPKKDPRGKAPGVKGDDGWRGIDFTKVEAELRDLDIWQRMGASVGLKTGRGLAFVDVDTLKAEWAAAVKAIFEKHLGTNIFWRVGNYPKAGFMLLTDEDYVYHCVAFGDRDEHGRLTSRVEILCEGRQFVAHGIHPATGKPYRWPQGIPPRKDLVYVPAAKLDAILQEIAEAMPQAEPVKHEGAQSDDPVDPEKLKGDPVLVERAVKAMRNTAGRDEYVAVGYALKGALPDDPALAFELYADWCDRWEEGENDPDVVAAEWARMTLPPRIGADWLYARAHEWSGGAFTPHFDPVAAAQVNDAAAESLFPPEEKKQRKFDILSFGQAADAALGDVSAPLIKGLLDQGAMTVLYGPSNVGKTFVAMDIGYHIAAGTEYAGMRVTKGAVLYVAAEGGRGAKRRVRALREKYGADDVPFFLLPSSVDLRRPDADLRPLISAIREMMATLRERGFDLVLIVIDTLSRAMAGGDENSSVDMGHIVTHFDALRAATSAHLLVVHHSGKNVAMGARGHSLLRAATDTEIEIGEGAIEVTKQRDLDKSWSSGFVLETRVLGVDGDGDPVTSCTVRLCGKDTVSAPAPRAPTAREEVALAAVEALQASSRDGEAGVSAAELCAYMVLQGDNLSDKNARYLLASLIEKRLIEKIGRGRYRVVERKEDSVFE